MYSEKYFENSGIEISISGRKIDRLESWIKKDESDWIRLDFFLEYYLTRDVIISKKLKSKLTTYEGIKEYIDLMLNKFKEITNDGTNFNFEGYDKWLRNNPEDIEKARNLFISD